MVDLNRYDIVVSMREIFKEFGIRGYLVGGAVRDMLLGVMPGDFDFVVELDEYHHRVYAEKIGRRLGCSCKYNDHYHTAKFVKNAYDIDFIMARDESYGGIAAKPRVWHSSIDRDLLRRDFTVNAMACPIWEDSSDLIDPLGGGADLEKGIIRVMHPKSFYDDPTRIFRALRYASRFEFELEENTEKYLEVALRDGVLDFLPGERIKSELIDLFCEKNHEYLKNLIEKYKIIRYIAGDDVIINNISWNEGSFPNTRNVLAGIFFRNNESSLSTLAARLNLGKSFLELCRRLGGVEEPRTEEEFYEFLFDSQGSMDEGLMKAVFGEDPRVQDFLRLKQEAGLSLEEVKSAEGSRKKLNALKARKLIRIIRSGI